MIHSDRPCRSSCLLPETNNHVLQIWYRPRDAKIKRYNASAVVTYISVIFAAKASQWNKSPTNYRTMEDAIQIIDQPSDLERARCGKFRKYTDNQNINREIIRTTKETNSLHLSAVLSWTGIIVAIATRVLKDGYICHQVFH